MYFTHVAMTRALQELCVSCSSHVQETPDEQRKSTLLIQATRNTQNTFTPQTSPGAYHVSCANALVSAALLPHSQCLHPDILSILMHTTKLESTPQAKLLG